jgi:hypothetical protein
MDDQAQLCLPQGGLPSHAISSVLLTAAEVSLGEGEA